MTAIKRILAVAMAAAGMFYANAAESVETHRFATYNIRYTNDAADTEANGRAWCARSEYVYRIIRDYGFDVFGIEEMTGRNAGRGIVLNPATGLSQREEIVKELSEYDFLLFERDSKDASNDYSYNAIAYRKDRYELVESDCFWISPTPDVPSYGWDPAFAMRRTCGWARLRVKSTGDEFYFFVVHCNYGPSLDGVNGARLVTERIASIAGNYPALLCGDFNLSRVNHPDAYKGYASKMEDSRFSADECFCVPEGNGQITHTTTEWTPLTKNNAASIAGNEFDYIYTRHMHVHTRNTITENFGRNVNPSDHYPIMAVCSLINDDKALSVHVDGNAPDGGDGSAQAPFNTISAAVEHARLGDVVKVAEGTYTEMIAPQRSLIIEGGYDPSFLHVTGRSVIDGTGLEGRPVDVPLYYDLTMSGFTITNAKAATRERDGAMLMCGADLRLSDVTFSGNSAVANSGGLYADCHSVVLENCSFLDNSANELGGGAFLKAPYGIDIHDCTFDGNQAKSGSAVSVADADVVRVMRSTFSNNSSVQFGTFHIPACDNALSYNFVDNTFANNELQSPSGIATLTKTYGGSAIWAKLSSPAVKFNIAHCTIAGNRADFAGSNSANFGGAAVNVTGGRVVAINNIIAGNFSANGCGDFAIGGDASVAKEQYNLFTCASAAGFSQNQNDFLCDDFSKGCSALTNVLDGEVDAQGNFHAILSDNGGPTPTVRVHGTQYGPHDIAVLTSNLRLVETSFGIDMDGDGSMLGGWQTDQRGMQRNAKSVPGACELAEDSGVECVSVPTGDNGPVCVAPGVYQVHSSENVTVFDAAGRYVSEARAEGLLCLVDLSSQPAGIYILKTLSAAYRVLIK